VFRPIAPEDLPAILALNNTHAVEVNALTADALAALVAIAAHARVIDGGDGFLLAFSERTPVQGPNHAWFLARYAAFHYIDRVVIAPAASGRGHAQALYADLAAITVSGPLCCEVKSILPTRGAWRSTTGSALSRAARPTTRATASACATSCVRSLFA